MGKRLFARGGEKAVNVGFLQAVVFGIQLALDGVIFTVKGLRHQINAHIAPIQVLSPGPLGVCPNLLIQILIAGLVAQVAQHQFFKVRAFFSFSQRFLTVGIQQAFKRGGLKNQ